MPLTRQATGVTPLETTPRLEGLGLTFIQRDWLSANGILARGPGQPSTLVDTGFSGHASITLQLVQSALDGGPLNRIINTHLHSDHCGGNAMLQSTYPALQTWVPAASLKAVETWNPKALSFELTGQPCPQFAVTGSIKPGDTVKLGLHDWEVHEAKGHDPEAVMLYEPVQRVLISGDALWEKRLAIIFPALQSPNNERAGFDEALFTLSCIEKLKPTLVLPGHGAPFADVGGAIEASRSKLQQYQANPQKHVWQAQRALLMFHMLEHQSRDESDVIEWLTQVPIFQLQPDRARAVINGLIDSSALQRENQRLRIPQ